MYRTALCAVFGTGVFASLLLSQAGCTTDHCAQQLWHMQMSFVGSWVENAASKPDARFSPAQLKVMVGEPDYVLSVAEFLDAVRNPEWPREVAYEKLQSEFTRCVQAPSNAGSSGRAANGGGPPVALDRCRLWVYEEACRFSSPLPAYGWEPGYSCIVFFVEDYVLGQACFIRWQALQKRSAQVQSEQVQNVDGPADR